MSGTNMPRRDAASLPAALVLSLDAALVDRAVAALAGLARPHRADPDPEAARLPLIELRPALVVVDAEEAGEALPALLPLVRRAAPGAALVALGDEARPELVLACLRGGAADFLHRDSGETALRRALRGRLERGAREAAPDRQGHAVALLGARPADPSRHVALALALARARAGAAVLLLDLSPGAAESLIALDLEAGYGVGEALEDLDRLDHALLASAVPRHGGTGLALLALDEGRRLEALPPGDVAALLALLRGVYDEVVVHAPAAMPALVPALPGLVRRLGFVLTQNLASARACADALRAAREGGVTQADAALLVVAAHDARILPAPNTLAGTLGLAEAIPVAERHAALCNAVNQGRFEAVLAERGLGREMARIAAALGLPEAPGRAARRLSWPWPRRKGAWT